VGQDLGLGAQLEVREEVEGRVADAVAARVNGARGLVGRVTRTDGMASRRVVGRTDRQLQAAPFLHLAALRLAELKQLQRGSVRVSHFLKRLLHAL
jgi:hypothetical protein